MKIIEALKKIKDLQKKADDLRSKLKSHSAHMDFETPPYQNQKEQVSQWLQAHSDILKEILRLRIAIMKTNLSTTIDIDLGGKTVSKTIAEWIYRRRDLAAAEKLAWQGLTDRGLKEGLAQNSMGINVQVKIIRCYEPAARDLAIAALDSEPTTIDGKLEIANAVTELLE